MKIDDFAKGKPWGILPGHFENLADLFYKKTIDSKAQHEAISTFEGRETGKPLYEKDGEVAIITISGPLSKTVGYHSWYYGHRSSYEIIIESVNQAVLDRSVSSIVLNIESPGGTVTGVESASDAIFEANKQKPIVAFANGLMASAAYWFGSAAESIVAEKTSEIGSIGVLMVHWDLSEWDKQDGIKRTYITAGKYKALGNEAEPLGEFAKGVFQDELDYFYSLFINDISRNRGVSSEKALSMADGKIFIGQQALDIGLVDKIGNLETALETARSLTNKGVSTMDPKEAKEITNVQQLAAVYPTLAEALRAEGAASVDTQAIIASAQTQATDEEKAKVLGLVTLQFGEEAGEKFKAMVETGVTVETLTALKALEPKPAASEKTDAEKNQAKILAGLHAVAPPSVGANVASDGSADWDQAWRQVKTERGCSDFQAMSIADKAHPGLREKWLAALKTPATMQ